jgi:hypothetical protein
MEKYKKFVIPAIVLSVFMAIAIPLSVYILSLPVLQITYEDCSGFSSYQLTNCIAFYQRQGDLDVLQQDAQTALWILWTGLFIGGACSFFVFPRISLPPTLKVSILFLGLLSALLLAGLPLVLFAELIVNGFLFVLSLVIAFLAFELALVSPTKEVVDTVGNVFLFHEKSKHI